MELRSLTRTPDIYRARRLRRETNAPEQVAWDALRKLRPLGFPVRRQHPIGGYIVDFAIINARLVIEIDGSVHGRETARVHDAERQADIEGLGWRVLRIEAQDAMSGDHVFAVVSEALGL
jgi:very-short-patch-repair endonuclease